MSKKNKLPARKKIALELLHKILGHRSTRSLLAGDTANVCEDIELKIDPDTFCASCQISSMNKRAGSKIPLKPKSLFKWVFMDIVPSTASQIPPSKLVNFPKSGLEHIQLFYNFFYCDFFHTIKF